eukprot:TRINITY_DN28074_c0_g1_i1.p1 TRINITY_DN28074_c0_g1~~TRINITY_DN28074_c0_g1_i1.p1  ORF type:complete len:452 (-),score=64.56 TRINITY_DN28074_c0_g1_i1:203-1477(-)
MALTKDKGALRLRGHVDPSARSFKFSDTLGPEGTASGASSPRAGLLAQGAVPGSPRGVSSFRGMSAGKIMSAIKVSVGSGGRQTNTGGGCVSWPHLRGSDVALRSALEPKRDSAPQLMRSARRKRSDFASLHATDDGASTRHDLRAMAAAAAAKAEEEAEVDITAVGGVGANGRTQPLSPRVRDSPWLDGLSPRLAERGGSRLFPTHMATPRALSGGSAPSSPRGVASPRPLPVSARIRSPRRSSAATSGGYPNACSGATPRPETAAAEPKKEQENRSFPLQQPQQREGYSDKGYAAGNISDSDRLAEIHAAAIKSKLENDRDKSPKMPSWAAPRPDSVPTSPANAKKDRNSPTATAPAPSPPQDAFHNGTDAAGTSRTKQGSRLQELRSKLEKSLQLAEQGLRDDLRILDQRLGIGRPSSAAE